MSIAPEDQTLVELAKRKLTRVLGDPHGLVVFDETLAAAKLRTITSPQDLYDFSEALARRGGMASAVGGILSVAAVLRGATAR